MPRTAGDARLAGMQSPEYRQVILKAAIDGSVIRGTLKATTGEQRDFHGWLELNTALEAILSGRADNDQCDAPTNSVGRCACPKTSRRLKE
jgi:hypothetical protein